MVFGTKAVGVISSMDQLHLPIGVLPWIALAIFIGGFINLPIKQIPLALPMRDRRCAHRSHGGLHIAVNVGGCLVPVGLAVYEGLCVASHDPLALLPIAVCCMVAIAACYFTAQAVPDQGIALPLLLPAVVAALLAQMMVPTQVAPAALMAGVMGPLVGADCLRARDLSTKDGGLLSIGGAGSLDGIVLSGMSAVLLT